MKRTWVALVAFMLSALLLMYTVTRSPSFQKCDAEERKGYADKQQVERFTSLPASADRVVVCTGTFLDSNSGGIQAVSAIVVALFTVILTIVTNRQAKLTKEAFIANNRASVFANTLQPVFEQHQDSLYYCRFRPI